MAAGGGGGGGGGICDRGLEAFTPPVGLVVVVGDAGAGRNGCLGAVALAVFAALLSADAAALFAGPVAMLGGGTVWNSGNWKLREQLGIAMNFFLRAASFVRILIFGVDVVER